MKVGISKKNVVIMFVRIICFLEEKKVAFERLV